MRKVCCVAALAVASMVGCTKADTDGVDTSAPASSTPATVSADAVDDRVEKALATDSALARFGLDADDDDNKVVLKGAVRTEAEKAAAAQLAASVAAGAAIENRIRIDANAGGGTTVPTDVDDIEDTIEDAFDADATLKDLDIDVDEDNGKIVLEGTVTAAQKTAAEELARKLAGAVQVESRIKVKA